MMSELQLNDSDSPAAPENCAKPWLPFYESGVPLDFKFLDEPIYHWLDAVADARPKLPACKYENRVITYGRLRFLAEVMAAKLKSMGVKSGDRVGIMLPNLPQTMIAFWGVLKSGAVGVMVNPMYMEKELLHQVADSGLKHMICLDSCWPKFEKLREELRIRHYFVTTVAEGLAFPRSFIEKLKYRRSRNAVKVPYDNENVFPFSILLKGKDRFSAKVENTDDALALLQYTGGTTGLSKGAKLTHRNVSANVQQMASFMPSLKEGSRTVMAVLPFFHVYGMHTCLVLPTLIEAAVVPLLRFSPAELISGIDKYKASILPGAPAMYISMLHQKNKNKNTLSSLNVCISGSAPMPVESMRRFEESFDAKIVEGYGLSEASPITHMTPAKGLRKHGSIGLPLPGTDAKIVDMELGSISVPVGKVGELVVRGPQVMEGYWMSPDETAGAMRNGWLYTGDIAKMDEDGFFYIVDRKKDMIIVGGYNVSPREIDEVLHAHPKIYEAVSVGVPHKSRGETIKAYIVLKEGEVCDRSEIIRWCRERLANYKVPRLVEFRDSLPKTLVGKILRRALRAEEEAKLKEES